MRALGQGHLRKEALTDRDELGIYVELRMVMGKGEAACVAMADTRGWAVGCDERRGFLRHARERLGEGRILNTPGILLLAIRQGLISVEEADEIKGILEKHRFKMRFGSFRDVLD
jgi:predicted nucleic acid-binding protein